MAITGIDMQDIDRLATAIKNYGQGAEKAINDYLHKEGGDKIDKSILSRLPVSGRTWKGKKTAAKGTDPFKKTGSNLAVTVHTIYSYHYLYFPDDGAATKRHYGGQEFMLKGAESVSSEIAEDIIEKILKL